MTADSPVLRTCAFGEQSGGFWGAVWCLESLPAGFVVIGNGADAAVVSAVLDGGDPEGEWRLRGDGVELTVSDASHPVVSDGERPRFDQLCRVSGRIELEPIGSAVSCPAFRAAGAPQRPLEKYDSIRGVAALFESDAAIGLTALRPSRAKGHAGDEVAAAVLEEGGGTVVEDPRLSTTYAQDGRPTRAALELWLSDEQGEQWLRRAAGEPVGPGGEGAFGEFRARADLFRWHSRGRDGIGVYLLARR